MYILFLTWVRVQVKCDITSYSTPCSCILRNRYINTWVGYRGRGHGGGVGGFRDVSIRGYTVVGEGNNSILRIYILYIRTYGAVCRERYFTSVGNCQPDDWLSSGRSSPNPKLTWPNVGERPSGLCNLQ